MTTDPSRPLRRLARRHPGPAFDRPRLWCAATTAVGLVALGAVTASSVPAPAGQAKSTAGAASRNTLTATGDSAPLHRVFPPGGVPGSGGAVGGPGAAESAGSPGSSIATGASGIPALVMTAYLDAQHAITISDPGCHLRWQMLAGIGEVESGQAGGGALTPDGTTRTPILGPALDGTNGNAAIPAPGGGWVRAEGPLQFLPSTWATWGVDGNGDGVADPNNIFDAALAAGHYLCANGRDLATSAGLDAAILSYNNSAGYLATVTAWIAYYEKNPNTGGPGGGTGSGSPSGTPSASGRPTPGGSPTHPSGSPTPSRSGSPTGRPTTSQSPSASPTTSASPSGSPSGSAPACPSTGPTPTGSGSPTPSPTPSPTGSGSGSPAPSPTGCPNPSGSASLTAPSPSSASASVAP
ncbi:hypothetical protein ABH931_002500 [Streptacidiphilus sp. MAP12-33]|uniref:lytic transglycosylase domain-containing protein n=1 Tax=Streptacidiphilus sp. MAP12-33 TaxID=3156266 RepID=UPI0035111954